MSKHLRWTLRIIAVLNIVHLASDWLLPQYTPLARLLPIMLIPLWFIPLWWFLTSLLLPVWSFIEIGKMNDATRVQQRKPILIDAALAFGWSLFFWATILGNLRNMVIWFGVGLIG